jgi:L-fucose isomerase-like protein
MKDGPVTIARITQDNDGDFQALVVPAKFEANKAKTFGAYGWARIDNLTELYRDVICRHFPHHTAFTAGDVTDAVWEAFGNYFDFDVFAPGQTVPGMWTQAPPFRK